MNTRSAVFTIKQVKKRENYLAQCSGSSRRWESDLSGNDENNFDNDEKSEISGRMVCGGERGGSMGV